ncbi:MAG: PIN domain-containing protein [Nostoc sp. DedQUE02]
MRNLFPGYYQPTEEEFAELWKECIFSFDTNVLLRIYQYSPKTRERFFDILHKLKQRIWIPYQVAYEFHKNRLTKISDQSKAYDDIQRILDKNLQNLKGDLGKYNIHSTIEINKIIEPIERITKKVKNNLRKTKQAHPDLINSDELLDKLTEILDSRIGQPYSKDKLNAIYKDAEKRFKELIPPGYKDVKKPEPDKYGDAILWFQLIEYAKLEKKPIIFITDDEKEDWWLEHEGRIISPRPELAQEVLAEAGVKFYMYLTPRFMKYAGNFLNLPEQPEAIEEAREIMLHDAAIKNVKDFSDQELTLSEQNSQEKIPSIADLTEIQSTIAVQRQSIADLTKINSTLAENLRSLTELPKINSPFTELTRSITELPKINSLFAENLRSLTELPKINSPFAENLQSITAFSKINSPFTELMRNTTELPKINSLFAELIPGKNELTKFSAQMRSLIEIPKINLPGLEAIKNITPYSKLYNLDYLKSHS